MAGAGWGSTGGGLGTGSEGSIFCTYHFLANNLSKGCLQLSYRSEIQRYRINVNGLWSPIGDLQGNMPRYVISKLNDTALSAMLFVFDKVQLERLTIQRISGIRDGDQLFCLHR
jgi:hypothetical protein